MSIQNIVSKILANDDESSYAILVYVDLNELFTKEFTLKYLNEILKNNPILTQTIVEEHGNLVLCDIELFDTNKCFTLEYSKQCEFETYIPQLLNKPFTEYKFYMFFCVDTEAKKSRMYFKIHHSYSDGYKLIQMLTEPFYAKKNDNKLPLFKRKTTFLSSMYYWVIATITLIMANIISFKHIILSPNTRTEHIKASTDFITCKPFELDKIKEFVKKRNMSINDFLYALMIKSDKIYTQKDRTLNTCSPINGTNLTKTNNAYMILNSIDNSHDNEVLFKHVNTTFNNYKYSLYIPFIIMIINNIATFINVKDLSWYYDNMIKNVDYVYTNMIGPHVDKLTVQITDIKFLTTAKNSAIVYNIISCKNNINIVCSFKKGIIKDKVRFEASIHEAYHDLMDTT